MKPTTLPPCRPRFYLPIVLALLASLLGTPSMAAGAAKITPSDVYRVVERTDRTLDLILKHLEIPLPPKVEFIETGLKPRHVYQANLLVVEMLNHLETARGVAPIPIMVSRPRNFIPADVKRLVDAIDTEMTLFAGELGVTGLPLPLLPAAGKKPTDVFNRTSLTINKLTVLSSGTRVTPSVVYAQAVRASADACAILANVDPYRRYSHPEEKSPRGLKPMDAFAACIRLREGLNTFRSQVGLKAHAVPAADALKEINPVNVLLQTQVILAELNAVKLATRTITSTPLTVKVTGKTPSDVHQKLTHTGYLLRQMVPLQKMVKVMEERTATMR